MSGITLEAPRSGPPASEEPPQKSPHPRSAADQAPSCSGDALQAPQVERAVTRGTVRMQAQAQGVVTGLMAGIGLFSATLYLVAKGGEDVGKHLGLLAHFFPGYAVTPLGATVGFAYGAVSGYFVGWLLATIYNWVSARVAPR